MLNAYPQRADAAAAIATAVWIDLLSPTDEERAAAAKRLGRELPTRDAIGSLASSNRVRSSEGLLCINVPGFVRGDTGPGLMTPLGILLTPQLLVTLRYAPSLAFDRVVKQAAGATPPESSIDAFVHLCEAVAGSAIEHIQALSVELSTLSHDVFAEGPRHSRTLRGVLFRIGRIQRQLTQARAAMLGVQSGLAHLCDAAPGWIGKEPLARLHVALGDLRSLAQFDDQMDDKVQFVLDATLGFINNEQNDIMRVLTVVSVVTIPPMILAGIWGMNFKSIPEYGWAHGYAFAWAMIALSMALPLAWFKWKKWF